MHFARTSLADSSDFKASQPVRAPPLSFKGDSLMNTLTARELRKMRDADEEFLLVNTLPADNFAATKIPGAINIAEQDADFVDRVEKKAGGKDKPVVVYCASMQCNSSTNGAEKLEQAGFTNVFDFEAGAEGWSQLNAEKSGGRKAKEDAPVKR
jgi:rhodanese-related sulfurtransferase